MDGVEDQGRWTSMAGGGTESGWGGRGPLGRDTGTGWHWGTSGQGDKVALGPHSFLCHPGWAGGRGEQVGTPPQAGGTPGRRDSFTLSPHRGEHRQERRDRPY